MTRLLIKQAPRRAQGRPRALSEGQVNFLAKKLDELIKKANCKHTVTVKMLKAAAKSATSERAIRDALHARCIYFRRLQAKKRFSLRVTSRSGWL